MIKNELRQKALDIRNSLSSKEVSKRSKVIFKNLKDNMDFINSEKIAIYFSTKKEVQTDLIIKELFKSKKEIYLPRILDNRQMSFYKIDKNTEYETIKGIQCPKVSPGEIPIDKNDLDLIICPIVSFDDKLNRLGTGFGYYDRYMQGYENIKIGIAFDIQRTDESIPTDFFDIKMDEIITD